LYFKHLTDININDAYSIITDRFNYLVNKGIKQYPFPYPPLNIYKELQERKLNFGLFNNENELLGIVTLVNNKKDTGWNIDDKDYVWISSLYVNTKFKNKKIGYKILDCIIDHMSKINISKFYLDCNKVGNYLEEYYRKYGFEKIEEKHMKYPSIEFDASLMYFKN
jgi:N-acetylglutamate synthase-like GNAT family acetyltransferase